MSRKRPPEDGVIPEPDAKRGPVPGGSGRPPALEGSLLLPAAPPGTLPTTSGTPAIVSSAARAVPGAPASEVNTRGLVEGGMPERSLAPMTAGAGARTVAARMMGNALPGGGPEDSSGSATVTHGGAVCRGGPSDEEGKNRMPAGMDAFLYVHEVFS